MYSKVKVLGHPVHPMLVSFPIVFYTAAFACFCVFQNTDNLFWFRVAYIANVAGVCAAVLAAIPGSIDLYAGVPSHTQAKKRGYLHAVLNVTSLLLFATNLYLIWGSYNAEVVPQILNVLITGLGFSLTVVASYHGYALVEQEQTKVGKVVTT
ncbi:hypothetical protein CIK05_09095 [Bdellovibrio sp. qaytius]|nr:hypothetical protein CIK05_09095 [Bdellovibrio sp. qaytius]